MPEGYDRVGVGWEEGEREEGERGRIGGEKEKEGQRRKNHHRNRFPSLSLRICKMGLITVPASRGHLED